MFRMVSKVEHYYPWDVKRAVGEEFDAQTIEDRNLLRYLGRARSVRVAKAESSKKRRSRAH